MVGSDAAERVGGMISLRPVVAADAAWLDAWLMPVAASVAYREIDDEPTSRSLIARTRKDRALRARIIERDGAEAGLLVYRMDSPKRGSAIIEFVATPRPLSRCGTGMGAAALLEAELRAASTRIVYAPAPAVHGIAMYFWIRLGYRPLMRERWPCERDGVAWLAREL